MKLKIKNGELTGFSHDEEIVVIPNWVNKISDYAFSFYKCDNPTIIVIPDSVTSIGVYAFYRCENMTVHCHRGSYAEQYCIDNEIKYEIIDDEKNDILTPDGLLDFFIKEYAISKGYISEEKTTNDTETEQSIRCEKCKYRTLFDEYGYRRGHEIIEDNSIIKTKDYISEEKATSDSEIEVEE